MSEKYGKCTHCKGWGFVRDRTGDKDECGSCGGTGFSGGVFDHLEPINAKEVKKPEKFEIEKILKMLEKKKE